MSIQEVNQEAQTIHAKIISQPRRHHHIVEGHEIINDHNQDIKTHRIIY